MIHNKVLILFDLLFFVLISGSIFFYSFSFIDPLIKSKWYWTIFAFMLLIFVIVSVYLINPQISINYTIGVKNIFFIISFLCVLQALYGWGQWFGLCKSYGNFPVCGSFDNPSGFSACLTMGYSFVLYFIQEENVYKRITMMISLIIVIGAVLISGSRTGIIAIILVSILWVAGGYKKLRLRYKRAIIIIVCFVIIQLFIFLYLLRIESADGRILIWINTWCMFKDNPLVGLGRGAFTAKYMLYQADYFKNNPNSCFSQLADNVNHPFNEYLLILVEYGLIGIFILFLGIIFLFYYYNNNKNKESFVALMSLVSIGISSCFSYPFRYPFTWIILIVGCVIIVRAFYLIQMFEPFSIRIFSFVLLIFCIIFSIREYTMLKAELAWTRAAQMALWKEKDLVIIEYERLNNKLWSNPLFLYNYSVELNIAQRFEESLFVAEKCAERYNDYDLQLLIAGNLMNLKRYNEAEIHYKLASYMCPNRFIPLYYIYQILNLTNRKSEALHLGEKILKKEEKIPSEIIDTIKKEISINLKKKSL